MSFKEDIAELAPREDNFRAMQNQGKPPWWRRALNFTSDVSSIHFLCTLAFGLWVLWQSQHWKMLPTLASNPVASLSFSGAVFVSSLLLASLTIHIAMWSVPKIKRWKNPPSLNVASHGGMNASIGLTHSGEPTVWQVRRRIIKLLYEGHNPDPYPKLCYLARDGKASTSLRLRDGETANIVLVNPYVSEWHSRPWILELESAENWRGGFDARGAIIELEIRGNPPLKNDPLRICFKVERPNPHGDILIEKV